MSSRHVVVDGSNIATEGRSLPSLAQLDQAVREFLQENPDVTLTVVVDATFGHRIEDSERLAFEEAEAANEVVSPPAGAIGRGDAFLLRIADKVGATVLSNDSFQEFHGEYGWLFDEGRLIGGKPVPGIGWIFTPRTPVRGPKSREAVKEAKRKKAKEAPAEEPGLERAAKSKEAKPKRKQQVDRAIVAATDEAIEPESSKATRRRRRRSATPPSEPVNEPASFFHFITAFPLGSSVEGTVESFSSHGAFVEVDGARCYIPLSAMADPAPRAAKEVLTKGEARQFVVQALDPPRRGIELALPEFVHIAGRPTEETVEAEIEEATPHEAAAPKPRSRSRKAAPPPAEPAAASPVPAEPAASAAPVRRSRKKAAAPAPAEAPEAAQAPAPEADAAPAPAKAKRAPRKRSAPAVAASAAEPATAAPAAAPDREPSAPAPTEAPFRARRSTKKAAAVEPAPPKKAAAARRTTKAAAAPAAPASPVPVPVPVPDQAAKKTAARKAAAKKAAATRAAKKARARP